MNTDLVRVTKHKKPRFQLYQPGFNDANSCWLEGDWITLPEAEWNARKAAHEAMYADIDEWVAAQYYRNKGTPVSEMTPAQKQAWEYLSGQADAYIINPSGETGITRVGMCGGKMSPASIEALRQNAIKIIREVITYPNGDRDNLNGTRGKAVVINQQTTLGAPDDLMGPADVKPVDPWQNLVKQNVQRQDSFAEGMLEMATTAPAAIEQAFGTLPKTMSDSMAGFGARMAVQGLIRLEENILRNEWNKAQGHSDEFEAVTDDKARYVRLRAKTKAALGADFEAIYQESRKSHNECARSNLDNFKGNLYTWVLPVFHDDGSHEPCGERDYPWALGKNPA